MKREIIIFLLVCPLIAKTQLSDQYYLSIRKADSLLALKQYQQATTMYSTAFSQNGGRGLVPHRYNAARAWAMAGYADSALYNLQRIVSVGAFDNYAQLINETDFNSLHEKVVQWNMLLTRVEQNQQKNYDTLQYPALAAQLEKVFYEDQRYRRKIVEIENKYGANSDSLKTVIEQMHKADALDRKIVCKILDEYGWLSTKDIGNKGNTTLFLVVQHADAVTQQKYLPMLEQAVKDGKAEKSQLAYLVDRVRIGKGQKQLYGTQIGTASRKNENGEMVNQYYVLPLEDPESVDKRRAEMEIGKLADYVKQWGIEWDNDRH